MAGVRNKVLPEIEYPFKSKFDIKHRLFALNPCSAKDLASWSSDALTYNQREINIGMFSWKCKFVQFTI